MTVGIVRLIAERIYMPGEVTYDTRVFDIPAEDEWLAERIAADMEKSGWQIHRENL